VSYRMDEAENVENPYNFWWRIVPINKCLCGVYTIYPFLYPCLVVNQYTKSVKWSISSSTVQRFSGWLKQVESVQWWKNHTYGYRSVVVSSLYFQSELSTRLGFLAAVCEVEHDPFCNDI
jgi:hypothetical protein